MNYNVVWKPLPGSQSLTLSCPCDEILYEGTRGPGKTAAQLARFRRNVGLGYGSFWRGVIFDTEYKNLADIITQSKRMYRLFKDGARFLASASELRWVWPTGEELLFRFGKEADDYWDYHGQEFPFIGFNELTKQKSSEFYEMMFSCRRSSFRPEDYPLKNGSLLRPIPLEVFSTTNPFGIGHTWVKKRFIEPAPRGTVIRETQKVFNPQTEREEDITLTRVAIHGSFKENPYLDPVYIATLMSIKDPNRKKAWVEGSWDVTSGGRFDHLWNATYHVIKPFRIPDSWTVDRSHDWGESKPFSNLWWAQSDGTEATLPDGRKFCPPAGSLILIGEWYGCPPDELNKGLNMSSTNVAKGIKWIDERLVGLDSVIPSEIVQDGITQGQMNIMPNICKKVIKGPADNSIYTPNDDEDPNDKPYDPKGKSIWARLIIKHGLSGAQEIGSGPVVHRTGIAFIQLFVPLETGTLFITQTADQLKDLFENQTDGQLDYFSVSADDVGDEGHGWYQLNLSIPYRAL
ncbi:TPA: phage tail terminator-like protein [Providencia rettgeri]